jgi:soluble lytic murein transglycosylase-like protein
MTPETKKIIETQCNLYQIDPKWIHALITVESNWTVTALKYEPNYFYLYKPEQCASLCKVTYATEIVTQKISWGLGQIMGALARQQGHVGNMPELLRPEVNIKHMCIYLDQLKKNSLTDEFVFAKYNGGPGAVNADGTVVNPDYVSKVMGILKNL